jgi:GrpB-like predicted nucleotidyltransferase (UPF0157 family)
MTRSSISVVSYDVDWPRRFEAERSLLEVVLAPWLDGGIHHVGSTAVAGLAAKPIVDMIAGVRDLGESRAAYGVLSECSYIHSPHRPEIAHHFAKPSLDLALMQFSLHLTEPGSALWRERIAFRDALRADPTRAAEYATLKRRLAARHGDDSAAYTAGKREFVGRALERVGLELGRS